MCGAQFWLKGWFHTQIPSANDQGGESSILQLDSTEAMAEACNGMELQISRGKKNKREDEGESRDDDETARPVVIETANGKHSSPCFETSLELIPSDALERIERAKAKATLMLSALQGLKKVIQSKNGIKQSRKRHRSSTLPLDFVSTKLTPIIESADSVMSQISNPDQEEELYVVLSSDDKVVGNFLSVSCVETDPDQAADTVVAEEQPPEGELASENEMTSTSS